MTIEQRIGDYLADGEWHTWAQITAATGISREEVRKTPMYLNRLIGSDRPSEGVKLIEHATDAEADRAIAALRSRARELTVRANALSDKKRFG